jgi:hypothetical protein
MVQSEYSQLDISKFEEASRYKFMMGTVIPRLGAMGTPSSRDGVVSGHRVSHQAINALGRIAGRGYCRTGARFDV